MIDNSNTNTISTDKTFGTPLRWRPVDSGAEISATNKATNNVTMIALADLMPAKTITKAARLEANVLRYSLSLSWWNL